MVYYTVVYNLSTENSLSGNSDYCKEEKKKTTKDKQLLWRWRPQEKRERESKSKEREKNRINGRVHNKEILVPSTIKFHQKEVLSINFKM